MYLVLVGVKLRSGFSHAMAIAHKPQECNKDKYFNELGHEAVDLNRVNA
jgi:hypothetical protein